MSNSLLLDTCAVIWIAGEAAISPAAVTAIDTAYAARHDIHVSPITAWELGLLSRRGKLPFTQQPDQLYAEFVGTMGITEAGLAADILIASSFLPGEFHNDPADRIIIATARAHDLTIVTRDRAILNYAAHGHVRTLAC